MSVSTGFASPEGLIEMKIVNWLIRLRRRNILSIYNGPEGLIRG